MDDLDSTTTKKQNQKKQIKVCWDIYKAETGNVLKH